MTSYLEVTASWLFKNAKGHDAKAFTKAPAFSSCPEPSIQVTSPDCGDSGATLGPAYMHGGEGKLPSLTWDGDGVKGCQQWLVVSEDPDAPLPTPICHGIYVGIPAEKTSLTNDDFRPQEGTTLLSGGFYYGMSRRGTAYIPPRPLLNHGIHRYTFDVIALSEPLDVELVQSKPTREQVAEAIRGKVLAWGRWMGQCERRWE